MFQSKLHTSRPCTLKYFNASFPTIRTFFDMTKVHLISVSLPLIRCFYPIYCPYSNSVDFSSSTGSGQDLYVAAPSALPPLMGDSLSVFHDTDICKGHNSSFKGDVSCSGLSGASSYLVDSGCVLLARIRWRQKSPFLLEHHLWTTWSHW